MNEPALKGLTFVYRWRSICRLVVVTENQRASIPVRCCVIVVAYFVSVWETKRSKYSMKEERREERERERKCRKGARERSITRFPDPLCDRVYLYARANFMYTRGKRARMWPMGPRGSGRRRKTEYKEAYERNHCRRGRGGGASANSWETRKSW